MLSYKLISFAVINCEIPPVLNGYSETCQDSLATYQTSCQFRCNPGFTTTSGEEVRIRICQADGTWSGNEFQCTGISSFLTFISG